MAAPAAIVGSVRLEGAESLDRKLTELDRKVQRKYLRTAVRKGAKVVADEAQRRAPVRTGALRKSITVRAARNRRKGVVAMSVTTGRATFVGDQFYGGMIEFGFRHGPRRLGNKRKLVPGRHFMERAFVATKDVAAQLVVDTLARLIETDAD